MDQTTDHSISRPPKLSIFNPHRLSDADLERTFIARQQTFSDLIGDITAEATDSHPQHHLIVGQRGMGKTTLLLRIALELRRNPNRKRFVPLAFPEDQHVEVDRLSKFWLNCLDALADTLEQEGGQDAEVERIDHAVQEMGRHGADEETLEVDSREAFAAAWQRLGRRPVLLLDNFSLLLARLRDHDYALRGFFTTAGAPIIVSASTTMPAEFQDYGAAFYDGFKTRVLRPLSLDELRAVIARLADDSGRRDVLGRLPREMPRLAALRDLTGGNPRTAVLLFGLFAQGFSEDAFEDLESLLDTVTPLYQSRLDQLSDQSQVIVGALARSWRPVTAAALAGQARIPTGSVSPQLGRLEGLGLVEKAAVFPEKKTGYQIAERFFNIWYLMRFSTRRQRASLACLTRFLQEFHTPAQLERHARGLLERGPLSHERVPYAMALASTLGDHPALAHQLEVKAQLELVQQMDGVRERIAEILDPDEIDARVFDFAQVEQALRESVPPDSPVTGEEFADLVLSSPAMLPGGPGESVSRYTVVSSALAAEKVKNIVRQLRKEMKALETRYDAEAVRWLTSRLRGGLITSWDDAQQISLAVLDVGAEAPVRVVLSFANAEAKAGLSDDAFARARSLLAPSGDAGSIQWLIWGCQLRDEFQRYEEAESAYREAIRSDPQYTSPWNALGLLLTDHLGRYEEAELAFRKAIEVDPQNAVSWHNLGYLLGHHLGRYEEAEFACRKAIEIDPGDAMTWNNLGNVLADQIGEWQEAQWAYEKALEVDPSFDWPRLNLVFLLRDFLGRAADARQILADLHDREVLKDTQALHEALFAAYDENWGLAAEALRLALKEAGFRLPPHTRGCWFRASAVLLHLGYGEKLVAFLEAEGADIRMLPWFAAVSAHARGDRRYVANAPAEARAAAEQIFDGIQIRRDRLPPRQDTGST